jgi:dTDP-4-dehydrorhamnose 3,5-epimerase-like enzyme
MKIKIIDIKTIPTDGKGQLSFFEANMDVEFDIKRIYYISGVPEGTRRGAHAHKKLKQLLFCPYGSVKIYLDDLKEKREIILDNPEKGLVILDSIWRDMMWVEKNSVLCVAASEYYDVGDYIRNYNEFKLFKQGDK